MVTCPASFWQFTDQFKKFAGFVKILEVVNDTSERAIKLETEFVNCVHNEEDRQALLIAVQRRRDQLQGATTKAELQKAYEMIVEMRK